MVGMACARLGRRLCAAVNDGVWGIVCAGCRVPDTGVLNRSGEMHVNAAYCPVYARVQVKGQRKRSAADEGVWRSMA